MLLILWNKYKGYFYNVKADLISRIRGKCTHFLVNSHKLGGSPALLKNHLLSAELSSLAIISEKIFQKIFTDSFPVPVPLVVTYTSKFLCSFASKSSTSPPIQFMDRYSPLQQLKRQPIFQSHLQLSSELFGDGERFLTVQRIHMGSPWSLGWCTFYEIKIQRWRWLPFFYVNFDI